MGGKKKKIVLGIRERRISSAKRIRESGRVPVFEKPEKRSASGIAQLFLPRNDENGGENNLLVLQAIKKSCYVLIMCVILPSVH